MYAIAAPVGSAVSTLPVVGGANIVTITRCEFNLIQILKYFIGDCMRSQVKSSKVYYFMSRKYSAVDQNS